MTPYNDPNAPKASNLHLWYCAGQRSYVFNPKCITETWYPTDKTRPKAPYREYSILGSRSTGRAILHCLWVPQLFASSFKPFSRLGCLLVPLRNLILALLYYISEKQCLVAGSLAYMTLPVGQWTFILMEWFGIYRYILKLILLLTPPIWKHVLIYILIYLKKHF